MFSALGCCFEKKENQAVGMEMSVPTRQGNGYTEVYIAAALPTYGWPRVEIPDAPAEPKWQSMDDLQDAHSELADELRNKIKKCGTCGKVCAYTLDTCNSCMADLKETAISFSPNVFMGFVYGVGKAGFPLKISLRKQDSKFLVFDDLLAMSTCHLNAIPADVYIPDWRYLLQNPGRGKTILEGMDNAAWQACLEQFVGHPDWTQLVNLDEPEKNLRPHVMRGMNYPPSQFQLHLQYIVPPMTPFNTYMMKKRKHYTYGRFFPFEYVMQCLEYEKFDPHPKKWSQVADTPIDDMIEYFNKKGVRYSDIHRETLERYENSDSQLAKWPSVGFGACVIDGTTVVRTAPSSTDELDTAAKIQAVDKDILQNYGRPYKDGKPTGTYYSLAKAPGSVEVWTKTEGGN
jgi:hypothetical protein